MSSIGLRRLRKEYLNLQKESVDYITAKPLDSNLFEWHYLITPPSDPYKGGVYHGKLVFPTTYPLHPPAIYMITPSGRFQVNTKLCLSISDYHPESWSPIWNVQTILQGILIFMVTDEATVGSIITSNKEKKIYASKSLSTNLKNKQFKELFGDLQFHIH